MNTNDCSDSLRHVIQVLLGLVIAVMLSACLATGIAYTYRVENKQFNSCPEATAGAESIFRNKLDAVTSLPLPLYTSLTVVSPSRELVKQEVLHTHRSVPLPEDNVNCLTTLQEMSYDAFVRYIFKRNLFHKVEHVREQSSSANPSGGSDYILYLDRFNGDHIKSKHAAVPRKLNYQANLNDPNRHLRHLEAIEKILADMQLESSRTNN
jgi:hypothetical protein